MNIDYNDERFQQVENEKLREIENNNSLYGNMMNEANEYYDKLMNAQDDYAKQQQELQQQNTDFAIEKINQAQEQAQKDYLKEQKGAYADYMKESNKYGANAEQMASSGLMNTGYSESSRVSMYNTYQNRVANARDTIQRANIEYSNQIKEAQLSNNSALAQIAYQTLENKLKLSLEGFQYKNNLLQAYESNRQTINNTYYNRYQDVLNQLVREKQFEEEQRQFNEQMALQKSKSSGGSSGGSSGYTINKNNSITTNSNNLEPGYYVDEESGATIYVDENGNKHISYPDSMSPVENPNKTSTSNSKKTDTKTQAKNDTVSQAIKQASTLIYNPTKAILNGANEAIIGGINNTVNAIKKLTSKNKKKK